LDESGVGSWANTKVRIEALANTDAVAANNTIQNVVRKQFLFFFISILMNSANAIIIENMERRIFHGILSPSDIAQALLAEFNRRNIRAQVIGRGAKLAVQIGTRPGSMSGGQTAIAVTIQKMEDGIMVELGQQAWLGVAASLGQTALSLFRNPVSLIGRLDDLAQDIENLQLSENIWEIIARTAASAGAAHQLSDRMSRLTCEFCGTANPYGEPSCIACGAPLGETYPVSCKNCGFVVLRDESDCPNCGIKL